MSRYLPPLIIDCNPPDSPDRGLREWWAGAWERAGRTVVRAGGGWGTGAADPAGEATGSGWWPQGIVGERALAGGGIAWLEGPDPDAERFGWIRHPLLSNADGAVGRVEEAEACYAVDAAAGEGLIGTHPAWLDVVDQVRRMAAHDLPVMLLGESGVGKEGLARLLHAHSRRAGGAWVPVNCGAIPPNLAESVLFGHRKGAFTGAAADSPGCFLQADGGTLFLDEVGALDPALQVKLLRVLEDGLVHPVGAREPVSVAVRVVCATQPDLRERVRGGGFRQDLYYRLAYGVVEVPPLRERRSDIPALAMHFLSELQRLEPVVTRLSTGVRKRLEAHHWPGNVRELRTVVGRMVMLADGEEADEPSLRFDPVGLPDEAGRVTDPAACIGEGFSLEAHLASVREALFQEALNRSGYNRSAAARMLGVSPQAVSKFVRSCRSEP